MHRLNTVVSVYRKRDMPVMARKVTFALQTIPVIYSTVIIILGHFKVTLTEMLKREKKLCHPSSDSPTLPQTTNYLHAPPIELDHH